MWPSRVCVELSHKSMSELFKIGKAIVDGGLPGPRRINFEAIKRRFLAALSATSDPTEILRIIEYDNWRFLIPYPLVKPMYERLVDLGMKDANVLRWYGGMLRCYSVEEDASLADAAYAEASRLDSTALS